MSGCIARCKFTTSRVMKVYAAASSMYKEVTVEKIGGSQVLHFQGGKYCRRLLLMQSEVQKPIWSSLGRFFIPQNL